MSQQDNSRAAVERLLAERAATGDPVHAQALEAQVRLHAELAGMTAEDVAALAPPAAKPAKQTKPAVEG